MTITHRRTSHGWVRDTSATFPTGARGYSSRLCSPDINQMIIGGTLVACPRVDWLYRSVMWICQHTGLRRLLVWYRNLED